jgi:hypothetical protein
MSKRKPKEKPLVATRTEAEVQRQILETAAAFGITLERRNAGGAWLPGKKGKAQYVRSNPTGSSDLSGHLKDGRRLDVEIKKEGFRPERVHGKDKVRFELQLARLKKLNQDGGVGLWIDDAKEFAHVLQRLAQGWRVEFDEKGYPWLTDD